MSLSNLQFSDVTKSSQPSTGNRIVQLRERFRQQIIQQKGLIGAEMKGESLTITAKRRVPNPTGTGTVVVEKAIRVSPWHFSYDGVFYVSPRYGNSPISLRPDGQGKVQSIQAGKDLASVLAVLDALLGAITMGELDAALTKASEARARRGEEEPVGIQVRAPDSLVDDTSEEAPQMPAEGQSKSKASRAKRGH